MTSRLELARPDDWHVHLRDGAVLADVVTATARVFARAIVMPNLRPPVTTVAQAEAYRARILEALPQGAAFEPLMTLYLTPTTSPDEIARAAAHPHVHAVKLYPAGATTNADAGVADLAAVDDVLAAMQEHDVPLLVHGESIDPAHDPYDREACFIRDTLAGLVRRFDRLRIVLEHVTTAEAVAFVRDAPPTVAATITAHHLLHDRRAMFAGGLRPHLYCLPVLKRERHRQALVQAATSGEPKFFLGTDSAPHPRAAKESACGCAGIFTAHAALPFYAEVFDAVGALPRLEAFACHHGADFYRLPRNGGRVVLARERMAVPESVSFGGEELVPLRAGGTVAWTVSSVDLG
jgi:dihydroorotase